MNVRAVVAVFLALVTIRPHPLRAQPVRDAMILFTYWPKSGQEAAFHDGYRKHLDWHRANRDSIVWYAWDVIVGKRTGLFIDGAFDIAFSSLDRRVKPAKDAEDFAQTAARFAEVNDRVLYRLRADLSSEMPLESRKPEQMVVAAHVQVTPDGAQSFESALGSVVATDGRTFTTYQVVVGSEQPQYLLLFQHDSWESIGVGSENELILSLVSEAPATARFIRSINTEVWRYRADLSYFP